MSDDTYADWFDEYNEYSSQVEIHPFSAREVELQLAILRWRAEEGPALVYADWLQEQASSVWWHRPQRELIMLQTQRRPLTVKERGVAFELSQELVRGSRMAEQLLPEVSVYRVGFPEELAFRPENTLTVLRHPWLAFARRAWIRIERKGRESEAAREQILRSPKLRGLTFLGPIRDNESWVFELPFRRLSGIDIEGPGLLEVAALQDSLTELSIRNLRYWDSPEPLFNSPVLGRIQCLGIPGTAPSPSPILQDLCFNLEWLARLPPSIHKVRSAGFACGFRLELERDDDGRYSRARVSLRPPRKGMGLKPRIDQLLPWIASLEAGRFTEIQLDIEGVPTNKKAHAQVRAALETKIESSHIFLPEA